MDNKLSLNETGVRWAVKEGRGGTKLTVWWHVGGAEADWTGRKGEEAEGSQLANALFVRLAGHGGWTFVMLFLI